jgi:hypothetical protein
MPPPEQSAARPGRVPVAAILRGTLLGLLLTGVGHVSYVVFGPNFHTVVPGAVYRCSQPTPGRLEWLVRRFGIRTVINLRGCCEPAPWYLDECRTSQRLGLSQEDLGFSAGRLPSVHSLRQLVEVLDRSAYPVLIHCNKGADRTGLASVLYLLLYTDTPLARALDHLQPVRGHLPLGRTRNMDRFFDLYQEWLARQGLTHSRSAFRRWAVREYCPGEGRADLTLLAPAGTLHLPEWRTVALRLRCRNTSVKPWHFQPGTNAGIHARYELFDEAGRGVGEDRAGLFHVTVAPGEHLDVTLVLPPLTRGRYLLRADLVDEQHGSFLQLGNEPLFRELEVP